MRLNYAALSIGRDWERKRVLIINRINLAWGPGAAAHSGWSGDGCQEPSRNESVLALCAKYIYGSLAAALHPTWIMRVCIKFIADSPALFACAFCAYTQCTMHTHSQSVSASKYNAPGGESCAVYADTMQEVDTIYGSARNVWPDFGAKHLLFCILFALFVVICGKFIVFWD